MLKNRVKLWIAVMTVAIAALSGGCGKDEEVQNDFSTYPAYLDTTMAATEEESSETAEGQTSSETEEGSAAETEESKEEGETETETEKETGETKAPVFKEVSETVTPTTDVNVRSQPSTDGKILGILRMNETAERTGIGDQGWDRVEFEGQTGYINAKLLKKVDDAAQETTKAESQEEAFEECNETVYAKSPVYVRKGPGTAYDTIDTLDAGEAVTRTGRGKRGWDRIELDGQTVYVSSSYLTTEKPAETSAEEGQESSASGTAYAVSPVNVRAQANASSEILGELDTGDPVITTGNTVNGWTEIYYNGQAAYVSASYLTNEKP